RMASALGHQPAVLRLDRRARRARRDARGRRGARPRGVGPRGDPPRPDRVRGRSRRGASGRMMRRLVPHLVALLLGATAATLSFPRDHGSHPDATLEWWYWTGHLRSDDGRPYGFQLTFFRLRDLYLAHFAWSDIGGGAFAFAQKTHLRLPG